MSYHGVAFSSKTTTIVLDSIPQYEPLLGAGAVMALPLSPRHAGLSFTTTTYAHTGGDALVAWLVGFVYNKAVVQAPQGPGYGVIADSKFRPPTAADNYVNATHNLLKVTSPARAAGVSVADVTGTRITLVQVSDPRATPMS